jgi:hypothetical protein
MKIGEEKCTIHSFDKGFVVGYLYIGVYGYSDVEFSLNVRWKDGGFAGNAQTPRGRARAGTEDWGVTMDNSLASLSSENSAHQSSERRGVEISVEMANLGWKDVCDWLRALDIDENVVEVRLYERL